MKKNNLVLAVAVFTVVFSTVALTAFEESKSETAQSEQKFTDEEVKSVAWYSANIKAARAKNTTCYENHALQATPNCINSQHALEISFVGGN